MRYIVRDETEKELFILLSICEIILQSLEEEEQYTTFIDTCNVSFMNPKI